jgi:glutamate-1-semialdehyde 2,1-aminomutase
MPRVGIVALLHESNTFVAGRTTLDDFRRDLLLTGDAVRTALADTHHEVGGFFGGLAAAGIEAVPILAARALPAGPIAADSFAALMGMVREGIAAAGPLDGVLVAPHGATVSELYPDADGAWLALVRRLVGPIPIIGTIDAHANLSPAMVAATDALVSYRTNPHLDQRDRGLEAARLMALTLAGRVRPVQAAAFPALAINIECQDPDAPWLAPHYAAATRLRAETERLVDADVENTLPEPVPPGAVLSTSIVLGFPYADVPEMGSAVIVVTNGDAAAARTHADALADGLWRTRHALTPALLPIGAALDRAAALVPPVCLLDMGDNVGGGSPADGTALAAAVLERGITGAFACVCDPAAVERARAAGVGGEVEMPVGGASPEWGGEAGAGPLVARWRVRGLTDGRFREPRPRHGGIAAFDQGPTAVLETGGLTVMATSRRMAPFSLGQLRHAGLDPASFRLLVAKGVHAPVAAYAEVCPSFVRVDSPGPTAADLARFAYHHRRRPLFPWEDDDAAAAGATHVAGCAEAPATNGAAHAAGAVTDPARPAPPPFDTTRSQAFLARSRRSLAMGVASGMRRAGGPTPLFFERGEGPYFIDVDGHRLLDYTLAWGPLILGNAHPAVIAAVTAQLSRGFAFGAQHEGEIELAERMTRVIPGVERVILSNTGSEAVQAALRLARAFTGRDLFVKFEGHYHGWFNNVLVSYRPKAADAIAPVPTCGGQPPHEFADTLVLPWNDPAALADAFARHGDRIAAVLTEPLLANSGSVEAAPGYLAAVIDLCRRHGAVSIFDEVITGFRLALGGAREQLDLRPDLSVYAKAMAAGFALSAVGGRREVFDVLEDGRTIHAGTYNGNPVNLAAAVATIDTLAAPGTFARMHAHGRALRARIETAAAARGVPLVTSGSGPVFSVHFGLERPPRDYRDTLGADAARSAAFRLGLLHRGVLVLPDGRWYVGAVHGDAEFALAAAAIDGAMGEV